VEQNWSRGLQYNSCTSQTCLGRGLGFEVYVNDVLKINLFGNNSDVRIGIDQIIVSLIYMKSYLKDHEQQL
jgi:hypothetical protein